ALEGVLAHITAGKQCPRKFLINANVHLLDLPDARALDNVNTANEFETAIGALGVRREPSMHERPLSHAPSSRSAVHKTVLVQYYALLREQAGRNEESIDTQAITAGELYGELQNRHPFHLAADQLKVAINDEFASWDTQLSSGDTIVFIPPVAGG
ncbi:MAG: MoaD/ThiS family protein, partial [Povalibacter sp.]